MSKCKPVDEYAKDFVRSNLNESLKLLSCKEIYGYLIHRFDDYKQSPELLDDLLELLVMSCQVVGNDKDLTSLTNAQLDTFQHEWLPMIMVPWIQRNFVEPKKRKPWMMAVRGFAMKAMSNSPNGTVIGKALEGLNGQSGTIKILIMLQ